MVEHCYIAHLPSIVSVPLPHTEGTTELVDVKSTNKLIEMAKLQKDTYPCLWVRGILPAELVQIRSEPIREEHVFKHMMDIIILMKSSANI